jgi:myo-inositol 2-dehydrogenase / D-chiro-inositol 1-dehydrogenase
MEETQENRQSPDRRAFLASSTLAAAAVAFPYGAHAEPISGSQKIKIGVIGCGGRGSGAAQQALKVGNCEVVAVADPFVEDGGFKNRINTLRKDNPDSFKVGEGDIFDGLEGYKKIIENPDVNMVILATPPGFRPMMFEAAVAAGKHVFMEKPVCVDAAGARKVFEAAKQADEKNLKVVVGLQRRYENSYLEAYNQVHNEGIIGDLVGGQVYWNGGGVWVRDRREGMSEMKYQVNNWYYFNWLCGDHICEQHIHNIDVANWFLGGDENSAYHPKVAQGMGGREVRTEEKFGEIYDHHYVEFTYDNGLMINSQCRHQPGCMNQVREEFVGTKGRIYLGGSPYATDLAGNRIWSYRNQGDPNPYEFEHEVLQKAMRSDEPHNDAYYGAASSFTSVLGRYATYSGKQMKWDEALEKGADLMPKELSWDADPLVLPDADGRYPIAVPGQFDPFAG